MVGIRYDVMIGYWLLYHSHLLTSLAPLTRSGLGHFRWRSPQTKSLSQCDPHNYAS